jgi:hypothetical protein
MSSIFKGAEDSSRNISTLMCKSEISVPKLVVLTLFGVLEPL